MTEPAVIDHLIAIGAIAGGSIPPAARRMARFSLFDWLVVARAGADQPVARIVRDLVMEEGGRPEASLAGSGLKLPARAAALANGTISHALDYDDTHFSYVGHPSVTIYPAAFAMGEVVEASAAEVGDAFLLGAEAACRIGMMFGRAHYERGFHQTATAGAFGATVAAGRLARLSAAEMRNALSLVATRASGLRSQFGTMGKPFNAGLAAANGVEAALLAKRGFISCDDGIGGPQGFIATHVDRPDRDDPWRQMPPERFIFEEVKYKLHACCHGTHAMIEALLEARRRRAIAANEVMGMTLKTNPRWLSVCDIKAPRTGLEVKFSYGFLAAMVLHGIDTAADVTYTDALGSDPRLAPLSRKLSVAGDERLSDMAAELELSLISGETITVAHDLASPLSTADLERGLRNKASALLGAATAGRLWSEVAATDALSARNLGSLLR